MSKIGVAIVGAGPYGLSLAAHLSAEGLKPRVFGRTMETWARFMPKGMVLKSEGFAMALSDPAQSYTLGHYCAEQDIPYTDVGWPVPVETFAAYGKAFQERLVPQVEETEVRSISKGPHGFTLELETGETVTARNVIMATGIRAFSHIPDELKALPAAAVSHSSTHGTMAEFAGRRVAVLGGGASAMDVAAALHRAGAEAVVISRSPDVRFTSPSSFRSVRDRLLAPLTPLGPGWKKYLCVKAPGLFRLMPVEWRSRILARYLGPAPAWSVHDIIANHVDVRVRSGIASARMENGQVALTIASEDGSRSALTVDHVIAATGYAIDVERLPALDGSLRASLRRANKTPVLSRHFETSVPGLFVIGTPSATSFGPMLRFVAGTPFASRQVTRRVLATEGAFRSGERRKAPLRWPANEQPVALPPR